MGNVNSLPHSPEQAAEQSAATQSPLTEGVSDLTQSQIGPDGELLPSATRPQDPLEPSASEGAILRFPPLEKDARVATDVVMSNRCGEIGDAAHGLQVAYGAECDLVLLAVPRGGGVIVENWVRAVLQVETESADV